MKFLLYFITDSAHLTNHLVLVFSLPHSEFKEVQSAEKLTNLEELVKKTYPTLDVEKWDTLYQTILNCMNYKEQVRSMLTKDLILIKSESPRSVTICIFSTLTLHYAKFLKPG